MTTRQKKILIIGHKGFIGKNLFEYFNNQKKYLVTGINDKKSQTVYKRTTFDYTIFAAGNSKTYLLQKDPTLSIKKDFIDLIDVLGNLKSKKFILLSSSLVYNPDLSIQKETSTIDTSKIKLYGMHKLMMEKYVENFSESWLILRLSGFYGNYLKKNLLYDLRNGGNQIYYHPKSKIDFILIDDFCKILDMLKDKRNELFNVGSGITLSVVEILKMIKPKKYKFISKHIINNSNFSIQKMKKATGYSINKKKLYAEVSNFINNI